MRLTKFNGNIDVKVPKYYTEPFDVASSTNLFKHLPPPLTRRRKKFPPSPFDYIHIYGGNKKKEKVKRSWYDMINIFECESDYDDDDGYSSDYSASTEFIRRKSKHKNNKLKKKKKKILIKFVVAFLVIIALKVLYDKFIYLFPGIFPTTGRLELDPNEVDHLYEEGPAKINDQESENLAQHRALFIPGYDETQIDMIMPIKSKKFF